MVSKGLDRFVLWPHYFDADRSVAEGRRVPETQAVKSPDTKWVEAAARKLGLDPQVEETARHPSVSHAKTGRVLVLRKGPKEALLTQVAAKMKESQASR